MKIYEIEAGAKEKFESPIEKIVPLIQQHCRQALYGMQQANRFLYRGVKKMPAVAFLGQSRENRSPSASSATFHRNINLAFATAGFVANRSNSIFATSDKGEAAGYALGSSNKPYMIFPIDGFKFTWSPSIQDLFVNEYGLFGNGPEEYLKRMKFYYEDDADPELINEFLWKSEYTDKDFGAAVSSRNEIMIHGQYYAVSTEFEDWPEFRQLIGS
jgi:hypothetical protein